MKRKFRLFLLLIPFFMHNISAQLAPDSAQQMLVPPESYVGDSVELRYTFRSAVDFFTDKSNQFNMCINPEKLPFDSISDRCLIKKIEFQRNGMEYSLIMTLVPWKPGKIQFPGFDFLSIFEPEKLAKNAAASDFRIQLEPAEISSIVEKTHETQLRPPVPPFVIPGTTYILFAIAAVSLAALIFVLRFLLKLKDFLEWIENIKLKRFFRKNALTAIKKIASLQKDVSIHDIDFCSEIQNTVRTYLQTRFDYPFCAVSCAGIAAAFNSISGGLLSGETASCVEDVAAIFVRTDYIRYAHDSIDSQLYPPAEHQAVLMDYERRDITERVLKIIDVFEKNAD